MTRRRAHPQMAEPPTLEAKALQPIGALPQGISPADIPEPNAASEAATHDPTAMMLQQIANNVGGVMAPADNAISEQGILEILQQIAAEFSGREQSLGAGPQRRKI